MDPGRDAARKQQRMERQARAAAAPPEQQDDDAAETALHLLLQHDSVRTQLPLVCRLLCCSTSVAAAAAQHSAGQLAIPRSATAAAADQPAAAWLRKHARLARSLDLTSKPSREAVGACVMAAGPQTLLLRSLALDVSGDTNMPLLEQLPASFITCLRLHVGHDISSRGTWDEDLATHLARVSAALVRLTALHTLELELVVMSSGQEQACHVLDLSGLSAVTSLQFHDRRLGGLQHNAPPGLLELEIGNFDPWPTEPVHLEKLTTVTSLDLGSLWGTDRLPPNLLCLRVPAGCRNVEPALALQQLQELELLLPHNHDDGVGDAFGDFDKVPDITADQLRQLTGLTALRLSYSNGWVGVAPASAAAWPLLPLKRLEFGGAEVSDAVCRALGQLTGLTCLRLWEHQLLWNLRSAPQQLATALRRLPGLQVLQLSSSYDDGQRAERSPQCVQQLAEAICTLQQLRQLTIESSPLAAAAQSNSLTALHALTSLSVRGYLRTNAAVLAAIASQVPWLQSLDCSGIHSRLTDEVMPAIGQLRQLTSLSLSRTVTDVTDAGLQHLVGLSRLQQVVFGSAQQVTDAAVRALNAHGVKVMVATTMFR